MDDQQDVGGRLAALEERLTVLEDERAIREVLARYGYYADACLDDDYYALFTEDCVMDVSSDRGPDPYEVIRWEGVDSLRDFMTVRSAGHGDGFVGRSLHVQGNNLAVSIHGTSATANGYSMVLHQDGPDMKLISASINEWRLRKEGGRWLIAQRTRRMVGAPDTVQVLRASES